jgi:pyruvate/2-oxoglutarate dehydrogenase complex dihydrolipoamide acyltransferase (E2) component
LAAPGVLLISAMDLIGTYEKKTFPRNRRFIIDTLEESARKHRVYGLVELDVTTGRQMLRELKELRGEKVSFTAWIVKCIAQAVSEHKYVNVYRHGRSGVVMFDDVDVVVAVERFVDGESINFPLIVRKANEKTVAEIGAEIHGGKSEKLSGGIVSWVMKTVAS